MRLLFAGVMKGAVLATILVAVGGCPDAPIRLKIDTEVLSFGATTEILTFEVKKARSRRPMAPLQLSSSDDWIEILDCQSTDDTCVSDGPFDPITITVRVDRSRMDLGDNVGSIVLISQGAVAEEVEVRASTVVAPAFTADNRTPFEDIDLVTFQDASLVQPGWRIDSYRWEFGQGGTSTIATPPAQQYREPGEYEISLTVSVVRGEERVTVTGAREGFVIVSERSDPIADFNISSIEPLADSPVLFTDTSTAGSSAINFWNWFFEPANLPPGNNELPDSIEQNPTFIFAEGGEMRVRLIVETDHGSSEVQRTIRVISRAPSANFRANTTTPAVNSSLNFEDLSVPGTGAITAWEWDFGDGGTDTRQNPSHTYTAAGQFAVQLTVTSGELEDTLLRENYIVASTAAPIAGFDADRRRALASQPVNFIDQSDLTTAGPIQRTASSAFPRWDWEFRDAATGALITQRLRVGQDNPDVSVDFGTEGFGAGLVDVTLTVTTEHGADSITQNAFIDVVAGTPLDDYLSAPEPCAGFSAPRIIISDPSPDPVTGPRYIASVIEMTSLAWRETVPCDQISDLDPALWRHWLTIIEPTTVRRSGALLALNDLRFVSTFPPTSADPGLIDLALSTGSVIATMSAVPNQPLVFGEESLTGDTLIARTIAEYIDAAPGGATLADTEMPVLLPMAKSVVAGMNTIQDFLEGRGVIIDNFVLLGARNQAWAAWLAAAADPQDRVTAIAPGGFDLININPQLQHQFDVYGEFSEVWRAYETEGIFGSDADGGYFNRFEETAGRALLDFIDPYSFRERYVGVTKLIFNGTGDPYFLPDSSQFYIGDNPALMPAGFPQALEIEGIRGDNYLAFIPDADQNLGGTPEIAARLVPWYQQVIADDPLPAFEWSVVRTTDGPDKIIVTAEDAPTRVMLYTAFNRQARDFRIDPNLNISSPIPNFDAQPLVADGNGDFVGSIDPNRDEPGWIAFFVQLEYDRFDLDGVPLLPLLVTTEVVVTPDTLGPRLPDVDPVPPVADFTTATQVVPVNAPVQFQDTSTAGTADITFWAWNFGDSGVSNLANPVHTYTDAGVYDVTLRVVTADGESQLTRDEYISAFVAPPVADFDTGARRPLVGDAVQLTDLSDPGSAPITSWNWEFRSDTGDLQFSTEQNPAPVFPTAGAVRVTLTVTTEIGSDMVLRDAFVTVFEATALDQYLRNGDPFDFDAILPPIADVPGQYTATVLDLFSQRWRGLDEVDQINWNHWITVIQPANVTQSTAMLFITGGSDDDAIPTEANPAFVALATATGSVIATVTAVPNQPLLFANDPGGVPRTEDALLAFSFSRYLDSYEATNGANPDALWPALLPMTKAAVRTMDAVQAFMGDQDIAIDDFVVSGASKRGWTTWLTAAVDERVSGIAPLVYDALNFNHQVRHQFNTYRGFSDALNDYVDQGLFQPDLENQSFTSRFETEAGAALLAIVDPYSYRDRLATIPKLLINSSGDQFFVPDSAQFYFNADPALQPAGFEETGPLVIEGLQGEKKLAYLPGTNHSLGDGVRAVQILAPWYESVVQGEELPTLNWRVDRTGENVQLVVTLEEGVIPRRVSLWQAQSLNDRDFRFDPATNRPLWTAEEIRVTTAEFTVDLIENPAALTAFFVEVEFENETGTSPHAFTTEVVIAPDELPAAAK